MSALTLAIEAAIGGGSLSLVQGDREIAQWVSKVARSKGEDLLAHIKDLLASVQLAIRDVDSIAVSAGPGSFTGIRIGLATALGLKSGLEVPMSSVSALEAMAFTRVGSVPHITVAIPMGRGSVCVQSFIEAGGLFSDDSQPIAISQNQLLELMDKSESEVFLLHSGVYERHPRSIDFGLNVASAIGMVCRTQKPQVVAPLFISKSF